MIRYDTRLQRNPKWSIWVVLLCNDVAKATITKKTFISIFYLNHIRIKPIFGVYFIGLRHFDKIETLVSYYMYYSELVKGEKLLYPIEPETITRMDGVYISVKMVASQTVNLRSAIVDEEVRNVLAVDQVGLLFRGFHECGNEGQWLWAQSMKNNEFGLLAVDCVKRVVSYQSLY